MLQRELSDSIPGRTTNAWRKLFLKTLNTQDGPTGGTLWLLSLLLMSSLQRRGRTVHNEFANMEKATDSPPQAWSSALVLQKQARLWDLALLTFHS